MDDQQIEVIRRELVNGGIGVLPTDTVYGIVASVKNAEAIEKIYRLTSRPPNKPFIVLVSSSEQLTSLKLSVTPAQRRVLVELWPGPVSAILAVSDDSFEYLHRGVRSLAVRMPALKWLRALTSLTGPIVATSANLSGRPTPAKIEEIKAQLPGLDFYIEGSVGSTPSKLVKMSEDGSIEYLERR
jgi:L-threonylcarbamoyladenylate synthase